MPYKSKAERERENWITLPEVVAQICSGDKCDEKVARRQLVRALADGPQGLGLLRWEREKDDRPPPRWKTKVMTPADTPPLGRAWSKAKIRWKTGKVRNDWGEYKHGKWRVLLIQRFTVLRLWPSPQPSSPDAPSDKIINLPTRHAGGRPTERNQVCDELQKMRDEGYDLTLPQKKLAARHLW
jgi:hypothetical protein